MQRDSNPKPNEIVSETDHGDDMQRRVRYQSAYAATLAVSFLADACEWAALYCELQEDVLLERKDGRFAGIQVKTRASGESFRSTEAVIERAICRFAEQEAQFPGEYFRFVLATNPGFYETRKDRTNLPYLLHLAREVPDHQILTDYLTSLVDESPFSLADAVSVLRKVECLRLPDLDSIHSELFDALGQVPHLKQRPCYQVSRIRNRLVEAMQEAAALPALDTRYYLPLLDDPRRAETHAIITRKRFTSEQIKHIVEDTFSDPYPHLPAQEGKGYVPERGISVEMYARPEHLKVFISSQMRGGKLARAREAAIQAVDRTSIARAWAWERSGSFSEVSDLDECIGHAYTSDALVLILADELTPVARKEYEAAYQAGTPCYILLKQGARCSPEARSFIEAQQRLGEGAVQFRNLSELKTRITNALWQHTIRATRLENSRSRAGREGRSAP